MLRNFRWARWAMPWWLPAITWTVAVGFAALGAAYAQDCRVSIGIAGLLTVLALACVRRQLSVHQSRHRRTDRQLGSAVKMLRDGCDAENWPVPPGLEDERTAAPNVRELRPLAPRARHARTRQLRP